MHFRCIFTQYAHDLVRDLTVFLHVAGYEDAVWAQAIGRGGGHGAVHAVDAGLVRAR